MGAAVTEDILHGIALASGGAFVGFVAFLSGRIYQNHFCRLAIMRVECARDEARRQLARAEAELKAIRDHMGIDQERSAARRLLADLNRRLGGTDGHHVTQRTGPCACGEVRSATHAVSNLPRPH